MEGHSVKRPILAEIEEERSTSALSDWNGFLDFTADDGFDLPLVSNHIIELNPQQEPAAAASSKARKLDPRLTCSNCSASRVPCACPEIGKTLVEEEATMHDQKRERTVQGGSSHVRCQVPGCEVDVGELRYHRRHRVCRQCANASVVLIDGESKKYCQQCSQFHVLSDFDEGKRSCRRILQRHIRRWRRKSVHS